MNRREPKYYGDIDEVWCMPVTLAVIILVVAGIVFLLSCAVQTDAEDVKAYNVQVADFNTLPKSDREVFAPFCEKTLDDDLLLEPQELPLSAKHMFTLAFPWFLLAEFAVCVISTFAYYWYRKGSRYHLADLPFDTIYGWGLFIVMLPIGWPFLLASRLIMWCESQPTKHAEKAEVKRLAEEELTLESNLQTAKFDEPAKYAYIRFRTQHFRDSKLQQEEQLREQIASKKTSLNEYGRRIKCLQRELGETKAALKQLEETEPSREATKIEAQSEWQQILEMRGVAKLTTSKRKAKSRDRFLRILIKVRVPYKNELYDFGDYEVTFFEDHFTCREVRSGVKLNHTNTTPTYPDSTYDFCFGPRRYEIEDYARSGRIVEALTLIIDCFHSVNPGHEEYIPGCYRKVQVIERTKRRLKLQQTFQRR